MTEVLPLALPTPPHTAPALHYRVAMPTPTTHLFQVSLRIENWHPLKLDLKLPVWTPGSYLVREYAKHLQGFTATTPEGTGLNWRKLSKNHWQVDTADRQQVEIHYQVYANDLSVRTNHLNASHGYFNPAALCVYIPGYEQQPLTLSVILPYPSWQVSTALEQVAGEVPTFRAPDYDTLVDSPFEIGEQAIYEFTVAGKPHQFAIWGEGNYDSQRLIADTQKIIAVEAELFGGLPYDRYLFLLHLATQGNGGLEHKFCCSLNYGRFGFRSEEKYNRFLNLVAHEFFHLWNVKRIRPQALEVFDYEQENYTPSLWFSEGTTSYYDQIIPLRAGIYDARWYLKLLSESITRLQTTPGRRVQPLSESSFDAWIKLYRPDANTRNAQISYYLKGELVSLLLDLLIRQQQQNRRSLDDVLRQMWEQFGRSEIGFTPEQLQQVIETVAGRDLSDFFHRYIDGTEELPFNAYLNPCGLELVAESAPEDPPYLGVTIKTEQGKAVVKAIDPGSPAQMAGIDVGDELLAMNQYRITAEQLAERLKDYQPGGSLMLTFFHTDRLCTCTLQLAAPQPSKYQVRPLENPSLEQQAAFKAWLGEDLKSLLKPSPSGN